MSGHEDFYKREEDKKWRESVETRLVSLTSAQKTTDDQLDELESRMEELEFMLEGRPSDRNDTGIKGDIQDLNKGLNELRTIMAPDALGHGGIKNRLNACEAALGLAEKRAENRWQFATGVAVATVGAIATIIVSLLAIEPVRNEIGHYLASHFTVTTVSRRSVTKARHRKRVVVQRAPMGEPDGKSADEGVPEVRGVDGVRDR